MIEGLIRNAIRFNPQNAPVRIVLKRLDEATAVVSVVDEGSGIPDEIRDSLFDRFVQARSETERGRGTGLGLSIAQGIAEMHGGRIWFTNGAAGGCTFSARLPLRRVPADGARGESEPR
jgi:signal transduction histidine kinase